MSAVLAVLFAVFFFLGCIIVFIRYYMDEHSDLVDTTTAADNTNVTTEISAGHGLDQELIEKFPIVMYSEVKDLKIDKVQLECGVCLNEFKDSESLRLLTNCDHVFHPQCIDVWLASHVTCPVCRTNVTHKANDGVDDDVVGVEDPVLSEPLRESNISEEQNQIPINLLNPKAENRSPRLTSDLDGKFPRSHSTGHSLVQINGNLEKYTLRLPKEVRRQIEINSQLNHEKSHHVEVWPKQESSKIGYMNDGEAEEGSSKTGVLSPGFERFDRKTKSDRWVFTMARPFSSMGASSRSPMLEGNRDITV